MRRDGLLLLVPQLMLPLLAAVLTVATVAFTSEEQLTSWVNVLVFLVLVMEGTGLTVTPLLFPPQPPRLPEPAVVVEGEDRMVTLDMENIEARSRNNFLPLSFLQGFVTTTVPPARTLPPELPPPPPPSSADDLD